MNKHIFFSINLSNSCTIYMATSERWRQRWEEWRKRVKNEEALTEQTKKGDGNEEKNEKRRAEVPRGGDLWPLRSSAALPRHPASLWWHHSDLKLQSGSLKTPNRKVSTAVTPYQINFPCPPPAHWEHFQRLRHEWVLSFPVDFPHWLAPCVSTCSTCGSGCICTRTKVNSGKSLWLR